MTIQKAIEKTKTKLIAKAKKTGIYENFGDKEGHELADKYIDNSMFNAEMNTRRRALSAFSDWCMNYEG